MDQPTDDSFHAHANQVVRVGDFQTPAKNLKQSGLIHTKQPEAPDRTPMHTSDEKYAKTG